MAVERHFLRDTFTEPGTDGTLAFDLSTTQGSPTSTVAGTVNDTVFTEVLRFQRTVDDAVGGTSFPTSINISSLTGTLEVRWRVQRISSAGAVQASSAYSTVVNTSGIKTETLSLSTTWVTGDRLAVSIEIRRTGGHGNVGVNVEAQDADSYVDPDMAAAANPVDIDPPAAVGFGASLAVAASIAITIGGAAAPALAVAPPSEVSLDASVVVEVDPPPAVGVGVGVLSDVVAQAIISQSSPVGPAVGVSAPPDVAVQAISALDAPVSVATALAAPPDVAATADLATSPSSGPAVGIGGQVAVAVAADVAVNTTPAAGVGLGSAPTVTAEVVDSVSVDPPAAVAIGSGAVPDAVAQAVISHASSPGVGVATAPTPEVSAELTLTPVPSPAIGLGAAPHINTNEFLYATSHLAATWPNPGNALGNTPTTWAGELNTSNDADEGYHLDDPANPLKSGATHTIRTTWRKGSNSGDPLVTIELWEDMGGPGSAFVKTLALDVPVTSQTGQVISGTFDTSEVADPTDLGVRIVMTAATGGAGVDNSAQVSHFEWEAETDPVANLVSVTPTPGLALATSSAVTDATTLNSHPGAGVSAGAAAPSAVLQVIPPVSIDPPPAVTVGTSGVVTNENTITVAPFTTVGVGIGSPPSVVTAGGPLQVEGVPTVAVGIGSIPAVAVVGPVSVDTIPAFAVALSAPVEVSEVTPPEPQPPRTPTITRAGGAPGPTDTRGTATRASNVGGGSGTSKVGRT